MEPVVAPAERRWGLLTGETALVLGLIGVIVAGTFLVDTIQPASERTNTIYGKTTMKVHNLGKGGIQPGAVQPRQIVVQPPVVTGPAAVTPLPTLAPPKSSTGKPTTAPTTAPTKAPGGGVFTPPAGGGHGGCTLIVFNCDPGDSDTKSPSPQPSSPAEPTTSPTTGTETGTQPQTAAKKTPEKKPTPASTPTPPAQ
jgi:hypothetical protein